MKQTAGFAEEFIMTVAELIDRLQGMDQDLKVDVAIEGLVRDLVDVEEFRDCEVRLFAE